MPSASPAPARTMPRQVSSWIERLRVGAIDAAAAAMAEPPLGPRDVAELEQAQRDAAGGEELDRPVALEPGRPVGLLAAGQRQVRAPPWPGSRRGPRTASGGRGGHARSR